MGKLTNKKMQEELNEIQFQPEWPQKKLDLLKGRLSRELAKTYGNPTVVLKSELAQTPPGYHLSSSGFVQLDENGQLIPSSDMSKTVGYLGPGNEVQAYKEWMTVPEPTHFPFKVTSPNSRPDSP